MSGFCHFTDIAEMTVRAVLVISLGGVQGTIIATRLVEGIPVAKDIISFKLLQTIYYLGAETDI